MTLIASSCVPLHMKIRVGVDFNEKSGDIGDGYKVQDGVGC